MQVRTIAVEPLPLANIGCLAAIMYLYRMGNFLIKRIAATIPVMIIVAIIVFTLIRLVPGDPAAVIAGNMATNEDISRIRTELGLDRSFLTQLGIWGKGLIMGDLGQSFFFKKDVVALIGERLEPTLALAVTKGTGRILEQRRPPTYSGRPSSHIL